MLYPEIEQFVKRFHNFQVFRNEIQGDECDVCKDSMTDDKDDIMKCDGCNVAVHMSCYGWKRIPKEEEGETD